MDSQSEKQEMPKLQDFRAPIEHVIMGSTFSVGGQNVDVRSLIKEAKGGKAESLRKLLTPICFQDKQPASKEYISRVRSDPNIGILKGLLAILKPDNVLDLSEKGINLLLKLSPLDLSTGQIKPEWEIYLTKKDEVVNDGNLLDSLELGEHLVRGGHLSMQDIFTLKREEGKNFSVLSLKLP